MFCGNPLSAVHKSTATWVEAGKVTQKSRTQAWRSRGKAKRTVALSNTGTRGVRSILDYRELVRGARPYGWIFVVDLESGARPHARVMTTSCPTRAYDIHSPPMDPLTP